MAIGYIITGISFLIMIPAAKIALSQGKAGLLWPITCIFILTIGELYICPIALSLVTKISPPKMISMMMGMWFLSSFAGSYLSGFIGTFWEKMPKESFFLMLSLIVFGAGLGMFFLLKPIKRVIGND
jgi:POT family proton-dependent oligopeptide transporter